MRIRHAALHEAKEQLEAQARTLGMTCTDAGIGASEVTMTGDAVAVGVAVHHMVEWCMDNGYPIDWSSTFRLKCYSCAATLTQQALNEADGFCPSCDAEIDLEDYRLWLC